MKTKLLAMAAIVGFVSLIPIPARADFVVNVYEDGSLKKTISAAPGISSGTLSASGSFGDFAILLLFSTSNSPGAPLGAGIALGTIDVTNKSSSSHTLTIMVSAQDFASPTGPVTLNNDFVGLVNKGKLIATDFSSYVDRGNHLFGTSDVTAPTLSFSNIGASHGFVGKSSAETNVNSTYSVTEIGDWNLSGNGQITVTGGNSRVTAGALPEPASLSMLALGGVLLGAISILRKRRLKVA